MNDENETEWWIIRQASRLWKEKADFIIRQGHNMILGRQYGMVQAFRHSLKFA